MRLASKFSQVILRRPYPLGYWSPNSLVRQSKPLGMLRPPGWSGSWCRQFVTHIGRLHTSRAQHFVVRAHLGHGFLNGQLEAVERALRHGGRGISGLFPNIDLDLPESCTCGQQHKQALKFRIDAGETRTLGGLNRGASGYFRMKHDRIRAQRQ